MKIETQIITPPIKSILQSVTLTLSPREALVLASYCGGTNRVLKKTHCSSVSDFSDKDYIFLEDVYYKIRDVIDNPPA